MSCPIIMEFDNWMLNALTLPSLPSGINLWRLAEGLCLWFALVPCALSSLSWLRYHRPLLCSLWALSILMALYFSPSLSAVLGESCLSIVFFLYIYFLLSHPPSCDCVCAHICFFVFFYIHMCLFVCAAVSCWVDFPTNAWLPFPRDIWILLWVKTDACEIGQY